MLDGDTIYGISTSAHPVEADINVVGTMASDAMEAAIADAVLQKLSRVLYFLLKFEGLALLFLFQFFCCHNNLWLNFKLLIF